MDTEEAIPISAQVVYQSLVVATEWSNGEMTLTLSLADASEEMAVLDINEDGNDVPLTDDQKQLLEYLAGTHTIINVLGINADADEIMVEL